MSHGRQPRNRWRPSVPDPAVFQLPKQSNKAITIKQPLLKGSKSTKHKPGSDGYGSISSTSANNLRRLGSNDHVLSPAEISRPTSKIPATARSDDHEDAKSAHQPALWNTITRIGTNEISNRSKRPPNDRANGAELWPQSTERKPALTFNNHDNSNGPRVGPRSYARGDLPDSSAEQRPSAPLWRPDVFVHAFVPRSFLAINNAPASSIISQAVNGIDFPTYVSSFGSPFFLPPMFSPPQTPTISGSALLRADELTIQHYYRHFIDCVMLNLEAQTPEVRSHDLFGVPMDVLDITHGIFSLNVPGLREGAPSVSFGDIIMVRQLILDPSTGLPVSMDYWMNSGGQERGEPAPGFTGFELTGTVIAVDKKLEKLHVRLAGVLPTYNPLVFNVSFVVQGRSVQCLQYTIADITHELGSSETPQDTIFSIKSDGLAGSQISSRSTSVSRASGPTTYWLKQMLFPEAKDCVLQTSLPQGIFFQTWYDQELNYEQMKAVAAIQSRSYGNVCYLIHGPPGTGKTKTIVEAVTQLANDDNFAGSILVSAPSDPAADTLALRLSAYFKPRTIFRLNEFSRTFAEVPQELLPYCYIENDIFSLPPLPELMACKVVISTCRAANILIKARVTNRDLISLQKNMLDLLQPSLGSQGSIALHWTALLVDEAAQATEPETLIPLAVVTPHTEYPCHPNPIFVMAGDQYQLGPRTYDKTTALHVSLLERLYNRSVYASHPQARKFAARQSSHLPMLRPPFQELTRNYRSHPAILAVPSSLFYYNSLVPEATDTDALGSWSGWKGRRWPVAFACNNGTDDCENIRSAGGGWYNTREAHKAINYAKDLLSSNSTQLSQFDICIMSPFRVQVNLLRKTARGAGLWELNIGPVEAFQGLESRVVIICTTRARSRFLEEDGLRGIGLVNEPKKLNVALTRAKQGLIVLGNPWVLSRDPHWDTFLSYCWRNGLWHIDKVGRDPRMPEGREAYANDWEPQNQEQHNISGLEAALLYKGREAPSATKAATRFMSTSQDDEMWTSGMGAVEALSLEDEYQRRSDELNMDTLWAP